ncbi:hypothetical protein ElyMa_000323100 [Elysia marginata]|uniref:Uncharacterized protein n=1 Tax=Elysia marginata TaxID=1093978 RepID=A0AAV4FAH3_9GAST|nr:hypothetical protein ElyMa_000323100 [Elysia marginata]
MAPGEGTQMGWTVMEEPRPQADCSMTAWQCSDVRAGRGCAGFCRLTCERGSRRISTAWWMVVRVNRDLREVLPG